MRSFRNLLLSFAEEDFREFTKRTISCEREILGVHIPTIRKLAKSIPKEEIPEYLIAEVASLEEVLMREPGGTSANYVIISLPRGVASEIKMRAFLLRSAPSSDEPYRLSSHSS